MATEFKRNNQFDVLIDLMIAYDSAEDGAEYDALLEAEALLRTLLRLDPSRIEYLVSLAQHGNILERDRVLRFLNYLDSDPDGDSDTAEEYEAMLLTYSEGIKKAVSAALHSENTDLCLTAGMVATLGLANPKDDLPVLKRLVEEGPDPSMQVMVNYLQLVPNAEQIAALLEWVKHPNWEVRINAVQELGDRDDAYLYLGLFISLIKGDPEPKLKTYTREVADRLLRRYVKQVEELKETVTV
jgi:hypothetical protein